MNENYAIRNLTQEDEPVLLALMQQCQDERNRETGGDNDPALALAVIQDIARTYYKSAREGRGQGWLAFHEGQPVAYGFVSLDLGGGEFYTHPLHRRHGIGTRFIEARKQFLQLHAQAEDYLYVHSSNRAMSLYQTQGFRFVEQEGDFIKMARSLIESSVFKADPFPA